MRPERVAEVAYDQMEGNGAHGRRFRHAVKFVRWRPDREPASCTFAQLDVPLNYDLSDVLESLTWPVAADEVDVDGVAVRLTSPDKVYFPKLGAGGTKRVLFDYYLAVAEPDGGRAAGPAHASATLPRRHRR